MRELLIPSFRSASNASASGISLNEFQLQDSGSVRAANRPE
ncbi:hypothetical protein OCAR_7032 [Afipia carboxidovorans OM5]|nr:hypothetical protein OCAR_7032 [Afipia carboxidovorans OM5]